MTKTTHKAFTEAVLAGEKGDAAVLAKYGVNLRSAVYDFTVAKNLDAVGIMVELGGDPADGIHAALCGHDRGVATIKRLLKLGANPVLSDLETAVLFDKVGEAELIMAQDSIDISTLHLLPEAQSKKMALALIEAGEPIRVEDFDEIVRGHPVSILQKYINAGAVITEEALDEALYSYNDKKFAVILDAGLTQGLDQKTLRNVMGTSIFVQSKPSFDRLCDAGVLLDKDIHHSVEYSLKDIADYPWRHPRRTELVAMYKECCEAIGVELNKKLCRFKGKPKPKPSSYGGGIFAGTGLRPGPL